MNTGEPMVGFLHDALKAEGKALAEMKAERDRLLRVYLAVQGVREFITLHRNMTGHKEVPISKVLDLLEDALAEAAQRDEDGGVAG